MVRSKPRLTAAQRSLYELETEAPAEAQSLQTSMQTAVASGDLKSAYATSAVNPSQIENSELVQAAVGVELQKARGRRSERAELEREVRDLSALFPELTTEEFQREVRKLGVVQLRGLVKGLSEEALRRAIAPGGTVVPTAPFLSSLGVLPQGMARSITSPGVPVVVPPVALPVPPPAIAGPPAVVPTTTTATTTTVPPATAPPATIATVPPATIATVPPATIATVPPATIATVPPATIATVPPATVPPASPAPKAAHGPAKPFDTVPEPIAANPKQHLDGGLLFTYTGIDPSEPTDMDWITGAKQIIANPLDIRPDFGTDRSNHVPGNPRKADKLTVVSGSTPYTIESSNVFKLGSGIIYDKPPNEMANIRLIDLSKKADNAITERKDIDAADVWANVPATPGLLALMGPKEFAKYNIITQDDFDVFQEFIVPQLESEESPLSGKITVRVESKTGSKDRQYEDIVALLGDSVSNSTYSEALKPDFKFAKTKFGRPSASTMLTGKANPPPTFGTATTAFGTSLGGSGLKRGKQRRIPAKPASESSKTSFCDSDASAKQTAKQSAKQSAKQTMKQQRRYHYANEQDALDRLNVLWREITVAKNDSPELANELMSLVTMFEKRGSTGKR